MAKPSLKTHSDPCCGECIYCHQVATGSKEVGCYVSPPEYSHFEDDSPAFVMYKSIPVTRPVCKEFKPKEVH